MTVLIEEDLYEDGEKVEMGFHPDFLAQNLTFFVSIFTQPIPGNYQEELLQLKMCEGIEGKPVFVNSYSGILHEEATKFLQQDHENLDRNSIMMRYGNEERKVAYMGKPKSFKTVLISFRHWRE